MMPRVSSLYTDDELRETTIYAWYRHIRGKQAASIIAKENHFALMRKYKIPDAERAKLEVEYDAMIAAESTGDEGPADAQAVQPELSESNPRGDP